MSDTQDLSSERVDTSAGHLSVNLAGRPEIQFNFAGSPGQKTAAFLGTLAVQAGILLLVIFAGRFGLKAVGVLPETAPTMVFLPQEGPGGGGGGGGNQMKEPPKKAEIPKPKNVPAPAPTLVEPKTPPPEVPKFDMPVTTLAQVEIPGAMQAPAGLPTLSQGSGSGGGGGTGFGTGVGPGTGAGLGPGTGGGTGGGAKRPGNGVLSPQPIYEAKPGYTGEAMRARIEGVVWVECTVTTAGVCEDLKVVRSLDTKFGLDQQALDAAKRWRFKPGTLNGRPVDVIVSIEIEFRLR
jgi:TonB family protein